MSFYGSIAHSFLPMNKIPLYDITDLCIHLLKNVMVASKSWRLWIRYSFIYSFKKLLLNARSVPGTAIQMENTKMDETPFLPSWSLESRSADLCVMSVEIETGPYRNAWKEYRLQTAGQGNLLIKGGTWIACWITDTVKKWAELPDSPWVSPTLRLVVTRGRGGGGSNGWTACAFFF